jgi:hypothetical protein
MIISHKYKFIFIKTGKTAGTSIEVFLSQHCGENDILTPIFPHVPPHVARNYRGIWNPLKEIVQTKEKKFFSTIRELVQLKKFLSHSQAWLIKCRIPDDIWKNYFKFCVERNPWDKTISTYYMVNERSGRNLSFDDYIKKGPFCHNYPLYTDFNGNVMVYKVLKYERLTEELQQVFDQLGVPFDGSLGVRAKSEYRKGESFREIDLTREQRDVIRRIFSDEIKMHGYS